ncbi:MAG: TIGR01777 family protein [Candidatus Omnitrophica bacterium]|nr:TIGR01777 family protein [Candidatus Omnitrophota bacterium]
MKLLITGGTGFIGRPLCQALEQQGHALLVVTRSPHRDPSDDRVAPSSSPGPAGRRFLSWQAGQWREALAEVDGVINLAGEPLAAKRWSPEQKRRLRASRVQITQELMEAMAAWPKKPAVLVSASAIGYYGNRGDAMLTEQDAPGSGFLAELCQAWEAAAQRAERLGVRVVRLRLGIVLGRRGGALAKMLAPFHLGLGGPLGSGRQWMSWIHLDDVIGLIEWALHHHELAGAVNATAPAPVTMQRFCEELGHVLHRPSWARVPAAILRLLLGEMAELLLTSQRVMPHRALHAGYAFRYPGLRSALQACCSRIDPST